MVLVARQPNDPATWRACRKKNATRSAFPLTPPAIQDTRYSLQSEPAAPLIFFPPLNGGFPTIASKPCPSPANNAGNASGQCSGLRDGISLGLPASSRSRALARAASTAAASSGVPAASTTPA